MNHLCLILGAQRAGTTFLYRILKNHPSVSVSYPKETFFFIHDHLYEKGIKHYKNYFPALNQGKISCEFTPDYLFQEKVCLRIKNTLPEKPKMICILRNPIHRAWSQYQRALRSGKIISSFERAIRKNPGIIERGLYASQIKRYQTVFGKSAVKVLIYDDLKPEPWQVLNEVFDYLGVERPSTDPIYDKLKKQATDKSTNFGYALRNRYLNIGVFLSRQLYEYSKNNNIRFFTHWAWLILRVNQKVSKVINTKSKKYESLNKGTEEYLVEYYIQDIKELENITNRPLNSWLA